MEHFLKGIALINTLLPKWEEWENKDLNQQL